MKLDAKEVELNGVLYVPKSDVPEINNENYVIVRSDRAGVFAGTLGERCNNEVLMYNVRRIWYWDGAASLSQLAVDGVSKPENCKFSVVVPEQTILGIIEIIPCTDKAIKSIAEVALWEKK